MSTAAQRISRFRRLATSPEYKRPNAPKNHPCRLWNDRSKYAGRAISKDCAKGQAPLFIKRTRTPVTAAGIAYQRKFKNGSKVAWTDFEQVTCTDYEVKLSRRIRRPDSFAVIDGHARALQQSIERYLS